MDPVRSGGPQTGGQCFRVTLAAQGYEFYLRVLKVSPMSGSSEYEYYLLLFVYQIVGLCFKLFKDNIKFLGVFQAV